MSFILDALRKSELERQRQSGPSIAELPMAHADRRLPVALVAIALLLAVNVAVLLWFLLHESPAPAAELPMRVATDSVPADAAPPAFAPALQTSEPATVAPQERTASFEPPLHASRAPEAPDPTLLPDAPAGGAVSYAEPQSPPIDATQQQPAGLAELNVDLHVYAEDPARRAVFINGRRYTEGMALAEGPMLEQITRDGVVINHRGQRYLLPRS